MEGQRGTFSGAKYFPVSRIEERFIEASNRKQARILANTRQIRLAMMTIGCDAKATLNILNGNDCAALQDGVLVQAKVENGTKSLLSFDLPRPLQSTSEVVILPAIVVGPPPTAPVLTAVQHSITSPDVDVAWTASVGADEYILRKDGSTIYEGTLRTFTDIAPGIGTFCYDVVASNSFGTATSNLACVTFALPGAFTLTGVAGA